MLQGIVSRRRLPGLPPDLQGKSPTRLIQKGFRKTRRIS